MGGTCTGSQGGLAGLVVAYTLPHSTIANDSTPLSFVGFMFATTSTRRSRISSMGMNLTRPLTT